MKKIYLKRVLIVFLTLIVFCGQFSIATNYETTKDGSIVINYTEDKFELKDELKDGEVNVLKSVEYNNDTTFDVSLKAQGLGFTKEKISQNEYNIVFVIDNSGSMYGDSGRVQACVSAINSVIKDLANSTNIQISVVAYSSGSHMDYASDGTKDDYISANTVSADTLLDLKHYGSSAYIGYVDNYGSGEDKDLNSRNLYRWLYSSTGKKFYAGNTNTQAGIIKAYEVLKEAENKSTATPVIILMSDGEATNYAYSGDYLTGFKYELESMEKLDNLKSAFSNEYTQNQLAGYNAILSANYVKNKLNDSYGKNCLFYTLGYSLEQNYEFSLATLNPTQTNLNKSGNTMQEGYEKYGLDYLVDSSDYSKAFKSKYGLSSLQYNEKYYEGTIKNIESIYKKIVNDSMTEYEYFGPIKTGTYLTIVDTLGEEFKLNTNEENIKMKLKIQSLTNSNNKQEKDITLVKKDANLYSYLDENFDISYDVKNKKVTFKILAKYVDKNQIDLTYQIDLEDDATGSPEGITYYTNDTEKTYYEFTPENGNTYYGETKVEKKIDTTGSITLQKEEEPEKITETVIEKNTIIENTTINNITENNIDKTNQIEKNVTITNEVLNNKNTDINNNKLVNNDITNNKIINNEIINNEVVNNEVINNKTINNITDNNEEVNEKEDLTKTTEEETKKLPKTGRDIDVSSNIKNKLMLNINII